MQDPHIITSDIPREVEDFLVDIKYIAGLPPGCKYDIDSRSYVDANSVFSRGYRTFFTKERRLGAFDFINRTISKGVEVSKEYPSWTDVICSEIANMKNALTNLKHVYHHDPDSKGRIETIEIRILADVFRNACKE